MLGRHVTMERSGIVADLDLQIARSMTGIERAEQRNQRLNDRLPPGQFWKIEAEFFSGRTKIKNAIFGERRRQRIGISVIETKCETMQRINDLISIIRQLRQI